MNDVNIKMIVTVRVISDLYDEFQSKCNLKNSTITNEIVEHVKKQVNNYQQPKSNNKNYDNDSFKKVNIRIDSDLYAEYKIVLIRHKTTPTADINRFMRTFVG